MSEPAKHTPTPWEASGVQHGGMKWLYFERQREIFPPTAKPDEEQHGGPLAVVSLTTECGEANFNLFMAAPDLLAALEYIVAWNPADWSAETARDLARAAIAKAKGGAS